MSQDTKEYRISMDLKKMQNPVYFQTSQIKMIHDSNYNQIRTHEAMFLSFGTL